MITHLYVLALAWYGLMDNSQHYPRVFHSAELFPVIIFSEDREVPSVAEYLMLSSEIEDVFRYKIKPKGAAFLLAFNV